MSKKVLICSKQGDAAAKKTSDELEKVLKKSGFDIVDVSKTRDTISASELKGVELGVVMGGDGTFLSLVRRLPKKDQFPLLGVNLGSLGFITEVNRDEMAQVVMSALKKEFDEERRALLEVELWRKKKIVASGTIFNDASVTKEARTTLLELEVSLGNELLTGVRADGYIVSTATGSTAYAMSAGGPILHPEVAALVLVPICPHSLSARPVVVPLELKIEIHVKDFEGKSFLVFDGQVNHEIQQDDIVKLKKSSVSLRLIRPMKKTWAQAVRSKLKMA